LQFKTWIKLNPIETLIIGCVVYFPLAAYVVMLSERANYYIDYFGFHQNGVCYSDTLATGSSAAPITYKDAIWLQIITFLTVGYGDYYPMTYIGRVISILTVLFASVYSAVVIGIVHNHLRPTEIDKAVYNFLANKDRSDKLKHSAGLSILLVMKANMLKQRLLKQNKNADWRENSKIKALFVKVAAEILKFRKYRRIQ
jgi:hypothetical protein